MKASIVIPCFNLAEYLRQAIESALTQTVPAEVIVINDGSTDNSLAIATGYDVKVVNQANKGVAGARNAGIMNSTGDVILNLDADDWIEPDYLAETLPLMARGVGIVATDMQMFGLENRAVVTKEPTLRMEMEANHLPSCILIRRKALLEVGGYNPRVPIYEDWNLGIEIMKKGWSVAVVHKPLFHYRTRPGSMVTGSNGHHAELHGKIKDLHPEIFQTA